MKTRSVHAVLISDDLTSPQSVKLYDQLKGEEVKLGTGQVLNIHTVLISNGSFDCNISLFVGDATNQSNVIFQRQFKANDMSGFTSAIGILFADLPKVKASVASAGMFISLFGEIHSD